MPTIALNGRTASALGCPISKKEVTYWSKELPGFGLRCRSSGIRVWFVQYRTKTGETRKHTLGSTPGVSFADARNEAERLIAKAKLGGDPAGEARQAKAQAQAAIRLGDLVKRYLAYQQPRLKPRSYEELARHLLKHAEPLHQETAGKVTQRAIVELLEGIARRGPIAANRVRASVSGLFAWGMKAGLVPANPVSMTFKPAEERKRERVLSDCELALIWGSTAGTADHDRIVRLLMLTGARRAEIAAMQWSELTINGDGSATWLLPSERSKNGLPHALALPQLAAGLLPPPRTGAAGNARELVFGEGEGPFSGWSNCKTRLDRRTAQANGGKPVPAWVLHDLRRTFVTRLNDLGVEPHVIEALVNHVGGIARAGVAGVYNRSAYATQKRAALSIWCEHIAKLTGEVVPEGAAEVVPLRKAS